jgi:hypothetical protein
VEIAFWQFADWDQLWTLLFIVTHVNEVRSWGLRRTWTHLSQLRVQGPANLSQLQQQYRLVVWPCIVQHHAAWQSRQSKPVAYAPVTRLDTNNAATGTPYVIASLMRSGCAGQSSLFASPNEAVPIEGAGVHQLDREHVTPGRGLACRTSGWNTKTPSGHQHRRVALELGAAIQDCVGVKPEKPHHNFVRATVASLFGPHRPDGDYSLARGGHDVTRGTCSALPSGGTSSRHKDNLMFSHVWLAQGSSGDFLWDVQHGGR